MAKRKTGTQENETTDFEDGIDLEGLTKKYYRTVEVASILGEEASKLRFWEKECTANGLEDFCCTRVAGKNRQYTIDNINNLRLMRFLLYKKRMTVEGAIMHIKRSRDNNAVERAMVILAQVREELKQMSTAYEYIIARDNFRDWAKDDTK